MKGLFSGHISNLDEFKTPSTVLFFKVFLEPGILLKAANGTPDSIAIVKELVRDM
jgi:hypothetical protein